LYVELLKILLGRICASEGNEHSKLERLVDMLDVFMVLKLHRHGQIISSLRQGSVPRRRRGNLTKEWFYISSSSWTEVTECAFSFQTRREYGSTHSVCLLLKDATFTITPFTDLVPCIFRILS